MTTVTEPSAASGNTALPSPTPSPTPSTMPTRPELFVLSTPQPDEVADFYRTLFGWELSVAGLPSTRPAGAAQTFLLREGGVGWLPFVTVTDLPDVLDRARAAGAERVVFPLPGQETDRAAIVIDPTGPRLGLWSPEGDQPAPALPAGEGQIVWIEEKTRDQATAVTFFTTLFGFEAFGAVGPGNVQMLRPPGGAPFAGVMQFDDRWAADHPPHWLLYASVADVAATIALAEQHGGSLWFPPTPTPLGLIAYLRDPAGNAIAVVEPTAPAA